MLTGCIQSHRLGTSDLTNVAGIIDSSYFSNLAPAALVRQHGCDDQVSGTTGNANVKRASCGGRHARARALLLGVCRTRRQ